MRNGHPLEGVAEVAAAARSHAGASPIMFLHARAPSVSTARARSCPRTRGRVANDLSGLRGSLAALGSFARCG
eukprot:1468176-Alexandrium_andersonii.AAC.1